MNKSEAKKRCIECLKASNIRNFDYLSDGESAIVLSLPGYERSPDMTLEGCLFFFDTYMEVRIYYTKNASQWISDRTDKLSDLYRLLNFINARIWPFSHAGVS